MGDKRSSLLRSVNRKSSSLARESFLDHISGPNELRFVPFNNMPKVCSKYSTQGEHVPVFDKQRDREGWGSDRILLNKFLQDYDYDFEVNKPKLLKGGGKFFLSSDLSLALVFEKQMDRPALTLKKSYEGAASQF